MARQEQAQSVQPDFSFIVQKYMIPLWERKWLALIIFITTTVLAMAVSLMVVPEYYSVASYHVEEPRTKIQVRKQEPDSIVPKSGDPTYVITQGEKLKSSEFLEEVLAILPQEAKHEVLVDLSPFSRIKEGVRSALVKITGGTLVKPVETSATTGAATRKVLLEGLKARISVQTTSRNAMIWITARANDKVVPPILVDACTAVWMAKNLEENKKNIRSEMQFAEDQKRMAYEEYLTAEKEVSNFKKRYDIPAEIVDASEVEDVSLQFEMERRLSSLKMAKARFDYLDKIFLQIQMEEAGISTNVKVIDRPANPGIPMTTVERDIRLFGTLGGLLVGIALVLALDFLRGPVRHKKDILSAVDIPILAEVPKIMVQK